MRSDKEDMVENSSKFRILLKAYVSQETVVYYILFFLLLILIAI